MQQARESMQRSMRWALRAYDHYYRDGRRAAGAVCLASCRAGMYADLRLESLERCRSGAFPGYAIGGLAVGRARGGAAAGAGVSWRRSCRPIGPRYLMGVGYPQDIVAAVAAGSICSIA